MSRLFGLSIRNLLRGIPLFVLPWLPPFLFEKIDFSFHLNHQPDLYYSLTGWRLPVDAASFALGGVLVAYLLRPRWAVIQIGLNAVLVATLFYVACPTYGPGGVWQPECYAYGPDGLLGFRLGGMMFCFGILPAILKAASKREGLSRRVRPAMGILSGPVLTVVMVYLPISSWFSGVTYLPSLLFFQTLVLLGIPQIATGILGARIGRSLAVGAASGIFSLLFMSAFYWTPECPGCDRSLLYPLIVSWGFFALLGGITELGLPSRISPRVSRWLSKIRLQQLQLIGVAIVITVCLSTVFAANYWDPSITYANSISPGASDLVLGQPYYPYVGGYYNSTQYRICCVEIGVNISMSNPRLLAPNNFLLAGMGVQSPNCCVDGWDFGWRADMFLFSNGSRVLSASSWETCDGNANCGGYIWEHLWYHSQLLLPSSQSSGMVFLRMSWEPMTTNGQTRPGVNWYYNSTVTPWTLFASYLPDPRLGTYFDIGLSGGPASTIPQGSALLYQFGVASKTPVSGWTATLADPSFELNGSWRVMERANIVQGDYSYWKVRYRWGGLPYDGVTARSKFTDKSVPPGVAYFSYTGATLENFVSLW